MGEPPSLTIPSGLLRVWLSGDAQTLVQAWQDPDVAAWNPVPAEPTLVTATNWIANVAERAAGRVSLDWAIESSVDHSIVGEVGLSGFSDDHHGAFIGYWLLPSARGQGMATNAVSAVTAWAHDALGLDTIVARCHEANAASQLVAARSGYSHERDDSTGHQLWISRSAPQI